METSSSSPQTPKRLTIPKLPQSTGSAAPRPARSRGTHCTHLTATRLFTQDFRCQNCMRTGSFGWLYRCSQDHELLLEEDIEGAKAGRFDKLYDIFEWPTSPRKRGPAARASKLSFFDEISDNELKHYTPEQVDLILNQRAHVLQLANLPEDGGSMENSPNTHPETAGPTSSVGLNPNRLFEPQREPQREPWLPKPGMECQFKCCHSCRPTMAGRSYLSLGGIADGDLPASAIQGFGFHLQRERPVALVKHVSNLGLRPNPPSRSTRPDSPIRPNRLQIPCDTNASTGFGLGIFTVSPPSIQLSAPNTPKNLTTDPLRQSKNENDIGDGSAYSLEVQSIFRSFPNLPPPLTPTSTHTPVKNRRFGTPPSASFSIPCSIFSITPIPGESPVTNSVPSTPLAEPIPSELVPLALQTQEEISLTSAPLTPMQETELVDPFLMAALERDAWAEKTSSIEMEENAEISAEDVVTQF